MSSILKFTLLSALVHGGYIVSLKSDTRSDVTTAHLAKVRALFAKQISPGTENAIKHVYHTLLKGYSADFSDHVLQQVKAMPEVEMVEEDFPCYVTSVQSDAPWGLARISSPTPLTSGQKLEYKHDPRGGEGVDVFILDTGINVNHADFEGRAKWGTTLYPGSPDRDDYGHGTHVAGIVAGRVSGVAKSATVHAVKILSASGTTTNSIVIAGLEWAVSKKASGRGCVINTSISLQKSTLLNNAADAAVDVGCVVVAAAGNFANDACYQSPSSASKVITVGASNINDERASFSNLGKCVDIFAPGEDIVSTRHDDNNAMKPLSGTSQASPHVAGLVAYLMTKSNQHDPETITSLLYSIASKDKLSSMHDETINLLITNQGYY